MKAKNITTKRLQNKVGEKSRKVKVPAKAIKSGSELVKWIEERINKAWK